MRACSHGSAPAKLPRTSSSVARSVFQMPAIGRSRAIGHYADRGFSVVFALCRARRGRWSDTGRSDFSRAGRGGPRRPLSGSRNAPRVMRSEEEYATPRRATISVVSGAECWARSCAPSATGLAKGGSEKRASRSMARSRSSASTVSLHGHPRPKQWRVRDGGPCRWRGWGCL